MDGSKCLECGFQISFLFGSYESPAGPPEHESSQHVSEVFAEDAAEGVPDEEGSLWGLGEVICLFTLHAV